MDRRRQIPEPHPRVSGFACPNCASERIRLASVTDYVFYLRCDACDRLLSGLDVEQPEAVLTGLPGEPTAELNRDRAAVVEPDAA